MPGTFSPSPRVNDPDMHHGTCVTHVPWCMPGSLTSGFLWSRWLEKRSQHSRRMRNPQFYLSGKGPMSSTVCPQVGHMCDESDEWWVWVRMCVCVNINNLRLAWNIRLFPRTIFLHGIRNLYNMKRVFYIYEKFFIARQAAKSLHLTLLSLCLSGRKGTVVACVCPVGWPAVWPSVNITC